MTDFRIPSGFEDLLRPPVDVRRARLTPAVLGSPRARMEARTARRIVRLARRTPEVMVKVTGTTRDGAHLRAHLEYISRNGALALEGPDGERLEGRDAVRTVAEDWSVEARMERRRRDAPMTRSIVLSMPAGTNAGRLEDAARAFATDVFGDRFPYVFALHDEGRHPHVHLTVRCLGSGGERLNPRKADLQLWREAFAARLRERDVPAEATPRRARGVVLKAERTPVRKMRERFQRGEGPPPRVLGHAGREALSADRSPEPWTAAITARQVRVRRGLLALALAMERSGDPEVRTAGQALAGLVRDMAPVQTRADRLRAAAERVRDRATGTNGRER